MNKRESIIDEKFLEFNDEKLLKIKNVDNEKLLKTENVDCERFSRIFIDFVDIIDFSDDDNDNAFNNRKNRNFDFDHDKYERQIVFVLFFE